MQGLLFLCLCSSLLLLDSSLAYRPVIIFHGILASSASMKDLVSRVKERHNGTEVYDIDGYDGADSLTQMWKQVANIKEKMLPIMQQAKDGVNMICFSQGGLVCRGILETTPDHNVHTFISLSSPQAGQFGDTAYLKDFFPNYTRDHIYEFFYTPLGQDLSVANYWRDPHHQQKYEESSKFLYPLNHPTVSSYKANFEQLKQLVLIGGPDDGVITPWQSSHFAFYDENEDIVEYKNQQYYKEDSFGLQTLDSQGAIKVHSVPGVHHIHWHGNNETFNCCIAPYLD